MFCDVAKHVSTVLLDKFFQMFENVLLFAKALLQRFKVTSTIKQKFIEISINRPNREASSDIVESFIPLYPALTRFICLSGKLIGVQTKSQFSFTFLTGTSRFKSGINSILSNCVSLFLMFILRRVSTKLLRTPKDVPQFLAILKFYTTQKLSKFISEYKTAD